MDKHQIFLKQLVEFSKPVNVLSQEASSLDWDYNGPVTVITTQQVVNVITRFIAGDISSQEIEDWANLIECREDLEFEEKKREALCEVIYKLANPVLEGKITPELCEGMKYKLMEIN